MKRILIIAATGFLLLVLVAPAASAFGVKDVIRMTGDEIPDSLIILKIENSGKTFRLDADDMRKLRQAGVSDEVVSAMLRTEGRDRDYEGYGDYYGHPYVRPYPRLFLGFGYHSYYRPYRAGYGYWGYGYPRYRSYYRPYSSQPYSGNYGTTRYRGSYGSRQPSTGSSGTQHRHR